MKQLIDFILFINLVDFNLYPKTAFDQLKMIGLNIPFLIGPIHNPSSLTPFEQ